MQKYFSLVCAYILAFLLGGNAVLASEFDFNQAASKCKNLNLSLPTSEEDGRIQTLNKKGAMSPQLDYATRAFLEYAKGKVVLEVGGAYGNIMLQALKDGNNTTYYLNDLMVERTLS